jgi:hypothetical protein
MAGVMSAEAKQVVFVTDTGEFGVGNVVLLSPAVVTIDVLDYMAESLHENDRFAFARHILYGGTIKEWEEDAGS